MGSGAALAGRAVGSFRPAAANLFRHDGCRLLASQWTTQQAALTTLSHHVQTTHVVDGREVRVGGLGVEGGAGRGRQGRREEERGEEGLGGLEVFKYVDLSQDLLYFF